MLKSYLVESVLVHLGNHFVRNCTYTDMVHCANPIVREYMHGGDNELEELCPPQADFQIDANIEALIKQLIRVRIKLTYKI